MRRLVAVICVLGVASWALAGQPKTDLSGKWLFNVQTDAGGGTPTVTL